MARFRSSSGEFVGWSRLPNAIPALWQAIVRKATGRIPRRPWIPFSACRALDKILTPDHVVWEVGAGYSTLWLSQKVKKVTSIEASKEWYRRLVEIIETERIKNVDLRYVWQSDRMSDFSELANESLDLLFIDGGPRGICLEHGFQKVKRGGHLYLDNWDSKQYWGAAAHFPKANARHISLAQSFVDYVPAQFGVYEGLLLQKA